jgi:hypothetical protein
LREDDEREDDFDDEIKPEDGLLRYWTFINGEQFRLFAALAAAFFGVAWCILYILGAGQTVAGKVLIALAVLSIVGWRLLDRQAQRYQDEGWKRDKRSLRKEKIEIRVAIGLWLFIFVSVGLILLLQWRRGH